MNEQCAKTRLNAMQCYCLCVVCELEMECIMHQCMDGLVELLRQTLHAMLVECNVVSYSGAAFISAPALPACLGV